MNFSLPPYILKLVVKMDDNNSTKSITYKKSGNKKAQIHSFREVEEHKSVIIFLHGFTGHPTETFKNIPELLLSEKQIDGYDIFSIGYSSSLMPDIAKNLWSADPDIDSLSEYFKTLIETRFNRYTRICLIVHSMGGLVAQNGILKLDNKDLKKIKYLLMFGTPSKGLNVANFRIAKMLKPQIKNLGSTSDFIIKLRNDWEEKFNGKYPFEFKAIAGTSDEFVSKVSSLEQFKKRYQYQIEGTHSTMIKANDETDVQSPCFRLILDSLSPIKIGNQLKENNYFKLNQFIAKNMSVIDELSEDIPSLDVKGLKKLALAYDSISKDSKAIKLLENHNLSLTDTDVMGIIGGRYKRRYLFSGSKDIDAKKAMAWYNNGYDKAVQMNNKDQIYYHAINLAFLNIVYKDDKARMTSYANIALEHCDVNSINIWELATIAEAYLYLGIQVESKKYYKKVMEKTENEIRMRSSIFLNAKFAYEALAGMEY